VITRICLCPLFQPILLCPDGTKFNDDVGVCINLKETAPVERFCPDDFELEIKKPARKKKKEQAISRGSTVIISCVSGLHGREGFTQLLQGGEPAENAWAWASRQCETRRTWWFYGHRGRVRASNVHEVGRAVGPFLFLHWRERSGEMAPTS